MAIEESVAETIDGALSGVTPDPKIVNKTEVNHQNLMTAVRMGFGRYEFIEIPRVAEERFSVRFMFLILGNGYFGGEALFAE